MTTRLQLAAMSRVDVPEEQRKDFFLYIDEFQNFASESFANILSEARKYRLSLILGHQYIAQLGTGEEAKMRDAVFGNVGTIVVFRIGPEDAEFLETEFMPEFTPEDLVNLGKYNIYVKLMIDGLASRPFSAWTMAPLPRPEKSFKTEIIQHSRQQYGSLRRQVEETIAQWTGAQELSRQSASAAPMSQPQVLYDAVCSSCKKPTKVVFPPDGKRPVYCKSCRKKLFKPREAPSASFYEKKSVNKDELKKVLQAALEKNKPAESPRGIQAGKRGVIQPGETVYFNESP